MVNVDHRQPYGPWWRRVGWLLLLWLLGVGALGVVAVVLKQVMRLAGLTS